MSVCGSQHSLITAIGVRDKPASAKNTTLKEIESWAKEGHEGVTLDCSRHSGQLMDNVTEQRLLNTKIWDLSKERHKFMYQNAYDQKMFLERQLRKSAVFKEMLKGVNIDGSRISYSAGALRRRASLTSPERTGARMALVERHDKEFADVTQKNCLNYLSYNQSNAGTTQRKSAKCTSFPPSNSNLITTPTNCTKSRPESYNIPAELYKQGKRSTQHNPSEEGRKNNEETSISIKKRTLASVSFSPILPTLKRHSSVVSRPAVNPHCYSRFKSTPEDTIPIQDPRYTSLTNTLSDQNTGLEQQISDLVRNIEALHVPPRRQKADGKPAKRIMKFMQQHGICI